MIRFDQIVIRAINFAREATGRVATSNELRQKPELSPRVDERSGVLSAVENSVVEKRNLERCSIAEGLALVRVGRRFPSSATS